MLAPQEAFVLGNMERCWKGFVRGRENATSSWWGILWGHLFQHTMAWCSWTGRIITWWITCWLTSAHLLSWTAKWAAGRIKCFLSITIHVFQFCVAILIFPTTTQALTHCPPQHIPRGWAADCERTSATTQGYVWEDGSCGPRGPNSTGASSAGSVENQIHAVEGDTQLHYQPGFPYWRIPGEVQEWCSFSLLLPPLLSFIPYTLCFLRRRQMKNVTQTLKGPKAELKLQKHLMTLLNPINTSRWVWPSLTWVLTVLKENLLHPLFKCWFGLSTVGLSDTAETITAGLGDIRLFQKTWGQLWNEHCAHYCI